MPPEASEKEEVVDRGDLVDNDEENNESEIEEQSLSDEEKGEAGEESGEESGEAAADESENTDADSDGEGAAEEDVEDAGEPMLPKARYDSVQARNRALQERIDRMEAEREGQLANARENAAAVPPAEEGDVSVQDELSALDDKINDALLDGDKDTASKLRKEQREMEQDIMRQEMSHSSQNVAEQAREQVRVDATVDFLEATYTQLDPNAKSYKQETIDEMETLRGAFLATGQYTSSQALLKAAKYMFPDMEAPESAPVAKSKAGAVKKAVAAANKQPPDISGTGDDASSGGIQEEINVSKLTMTDMESLPEATLKRLRGDVF